MQFSLNSCCIDLREVQSNAVTQSKNEEKGEEKKAIQEKKQISTVKLAEHPSPCNNITE